MGINYNRWQQGASYALNLLAKCMYNHIIDYMEYVNLPKDLRDNVKKMFVASTTTYKQLRHELNNMQH